MKAKSNSNNLPKVNTTTKSNTPVKLSKSTQKEDTKKLPAVILNEKIVPVVPEVVQLLIDPSVGETIPIVDDIAIVATEEPSSTATEETAPIQVVAEPIPPPLSPEEMIERKKNNEDFLLCCGKYNGKDTFGDPRKARVLFDRGIDVDYIDSDGWSALFYAAGECVNYTTVSDMISLPYITALFYAAGEGHSRLVQWLVEDFNATVDLKAPDECTALWTACFNGHRDVVSYLLRVGADDTVQGKPPGEPVQSPAMAARRNRHPGIADFIDYESDLRKNNPDRRKRQIAREMTREEFRESLKSSPQFLAMEGGSS